MFKNEYLEECLIKGKGSHYVLTNYRYTQDNNFLNDKLVIEDLGFIYDDENAIISFKKTLMKANIKEFILTEASTALIKDIHALNHVNIKFKDVAYTTKINIWNKKEELKMGLLMEVLENE